MLYSFSIFNHGKLQDLTVVFRSRDRLNPGNTEYSGMLPCQEAVKGRLTLGLLRLQSHAVKRDFFKASAAFSRLLDGASVKTLDIRPNPQLSQSGIAEHGYAADLRITDELNSLQAHRARYTVRFNGCSIISEELSVDNREIARSRHGRLSFCGLSLDHRCNEDLKDTLYPEYLQNCVNCGRQDSVLLRIAARFPGYLPLAWSAERELRSLFNGIRMLSGSGDAGKNAETGFALDDLDRLRSIA